MEFLKRPYILQVAAMVTAILIAFGVAIVAFTIYALATAQTLPVQFDRVGFVTCQSHSADRTYSNCPIADFALALADSFAGPDHDHGISIYHDHPGVHSPDGHEHPEYEPTVHSHVGVAQAANLQALRERVAVLEATEEHAHPEYVANAHEHEYTEEFTIEGVGRQNVVLPDAFTGTWTMTLAWPEVVPEPANTSGQSRVTANGQGTHLVNTINNSVRRVTYGTSSFQPLVFGAHDVYMDVTVQTPREDIAWTVTFTPVVE